ncbi:DUF2610 domain-containing protein [Candidatus Mesenet endosymbiont of Agriotes lineatus]|uniref:DUF2610 domain-containing protein n=1 Tax=Candidatus Mesenet endosymbiont of Agriotes lineatus TaxID=3077948 RepID=UPI0030CB93A7
MESELGEEDNMSLPDFIKKFTVPCDFGNQSVPFSIYIGEPKPDVHPIYHQDSWLARERGGNIPTKIKNSLEKLYDLAQKNGVLFSDLCVYAITVSKHDNTKPNDSSGK